MEYALVFFILTTVTFFANSRYHKHVAKNLSIQLAETEQHYEYWRNAYKQKNTQYWEMFSKMEELITKLREAEVKLRDYQTFSLIKGK